MRSFRTNIIKNLSNAFGWRTKRQLVIIESDDWGSIRMPSLAAFERLRTKGLNLTGGDSKRYNTLDTLASSVDLEALFNVLRRFSDHWGNHPAITALSLCCNPDFEKIKKDGYQHYHYESFITTLERYHQTEAFSMWQEGMAQKLFLPQFHGREHLNIAVWLRALQRGDQATLAAFEERCWGFKNSDPSGVNYQAAFDLAHTEDLKQQAAVIQDGLKMFKQLLGYTPSYFVPPNGSFNNSLEQVAKQSGIAFLCKAKIQREPLGDGRTRRVFHYLGEVNKEQQITLTRNCFFEPSRYGDQAIESCLQEMATAFRWRKPAIISTHRVNYIGGLDPSNRKQGLHRLERLLEEILRRFPQTEFLTSASLGEMILAEKV